MIAEAERMTAAWLSDTNASEGFNAMLALAPLDAPDTRPDNLATFTTEVDDGDVARGVLPTTLPGLAVLVDQIVDMDGSSVSITGDGRMRLRIRIGVENSLSAKAVLDLSYYLRVAKRSLRRFFLADPSSRTRNQVYLESCESMSGQIAATKDQAGNVTISAYLLLDVQLRDLLTP